MQGKGTVPLLKESEPLCAGEGRFLPAAPCKESRGGEPLVWSRMDGWLGKAEREREREMDEPRGCGFLMVAGLVGEAWNLFKKK